MIASAIWALFALESSSTTRWAPLRPVFWDLALETATSTILSAHASWATLLRVIGHPPRSFQRRRGNAAGASHLARCATLIRPTGVTLVFTTSIVSALAGCAFCRQ